MKDTNHLDLFERYDRQQMSPAERGDLEQRLHTDPDFAAEWQFYQLAVQAAQEDARARADTAALQQQLEAEGFFEETHRAIREEMAEERAAKSTPADVPLWVSRLSPALRRWAVAAGLAAVATGMWLLNEGRREREIAAVIEEQIETERMGLLSNESPDNLYRHGMAGQSDTIAQIKQLLQDKKTDEALLLLAAKSYPSDDVNYLYALAWFDKGEYDRCLKKIAEVLASPGVYSPIKWKSQLLQIRVCLKKGDRAKATELLNAFLLEDQHRPDKQSFIGQALQLK